MSNPNQPSQPHLHIFNAIRTATPNDGHDFHHFPLLPPEIRQEIWLHALQRPRIIAIRFSYLIIPNYCEIPTYREKQEPYFVGANRSWLFNDLLRVGHEARRAALKFYRVRIPCTTQPGFLYFNPEYDFINFECTGLHSCWMYVHKVLALIHFIHDLKFTYGPHQVGLLNLAIAKQFPGPCASR